MNFVMNTLVWWVLRPGNFILILGCIGVLYMSRAWGRGLVAFAMLVFLAIAILPVGQWLTGPLEERFPNQPLPDRVDGVVVMTGTALVGHLMAVRGEPALTEEAERVVALLEMIRRYPDAKIVYGKAPLGPLSTSDVDATKVVAQKLGIDTSRVLWDETSQSIVDNARKAKSLAEPQTGQKWLLVTSAMEMPRTMGVFRELDWEMTPYSVDYRTTGPWETRGIGFFLSNSLSQLDEAAREWISLFFYWATGKIATIFPAPAPSPAG